MKHLFVISILAAAVGVCTADGNASVEFHSEISVGGKCLNQSGLSLQEIGTFMTNLTAESFTEACDNVQKYEQVWSCLIDGLDTSIVGDRVPKFSALLQILQAMAVLCNDSKINAGCIAQLSRKDNEIEACVDSHGGFSLATDNSFLDMCLPWLIRIRCSGELLRNCDSYTAAAVEDRGKWFIPTECAFLSIVG